MASADKWVWMPHAGHFICAAWCRFHLNTYVGGYIVSTVGELVPDEPVREILARSRGIELEGRGDARLNDWIRKVGGGVGEDIGSDRKYETLVFKARPSDETELQTQCCPYVPADWFEMDGAGYNTARDAYRGHLELCAKWAQREDAQKEG